MDFVHALALGVDPAWRRLPRSERRRSARELAGACAGGRDVTTLTYSGIGLEAGTDLLLWSLGPSLDALEERAAAALRTGLGGWASARESFVGRLAGSPYVRRPADRAPALFAGTGGRYLVVYPFTKTDEWYRLSQEARQGIMNEHMRIGRGFPQVRQLLATSFGLGDQDYVVAYETDDLSAFSALVRALRGTEGRRATARDTPVLPVVRRGIEEIAGLLAG